MSISVVSCEENVMFLSGHNIGGSCASRSAFSSQGFLGIYISSHLPTCSNLQAWLGLEHVLLWKQKKLQYFFDKSKGKSSFVWKPSLQWKWPAFVKSFAPTIGLSFCFLVTLSRAGVLGEEAYVSGVHDRLQHNHNHEFSDTLINQFFQERPPTCYNFCNLLVCGLLVAVEWILKEVYISTIPINYQESPNQCWFISGNIIAIQFPTQHYPPTCHDFCN